MERIVDANGVKIWCEGFGDPADPAVILSSGATSQSLLWHEDFCRALADGGRYIVRYDTRDTGMSASIDFDEHPYTLADMAADGGGMLDALGVEAAHLVGQSMGGMVCQEAALRDPDRVLTLTSIMSSPAVTREDGLWSSDLPPIDPKLAAFPPIEFSNPPTEDQIMEATSTPTAARECRAERPYGSLSAASSSAESVSARTGSGTWKRRVAGFDYFA